MPWQWWSEAEADCEDRFLARRFATLMFSGADVSLESLESMLTRLGSGFLLTSNCKVATLLDYPESSAPDPSHCVDEDQDSSPVCAFLVHLERD